MNSYMVDIDLPKKLNDEFIMRIPQQRAFVKKMMKKGVISNYSLSFDKRKLWVVIHADSSLNVRKTISSFPIYQFIQFRINSLLFHESNFTSIPQMWLN